MHLVGAFANGKTVECHLSPEGVDRAVFASFPEPEDGYIDLPTTPGIGVEWNHNVLAETKITR
jgi:L-alanine-DL-glutamate epimerase-like enolase superfamily enzyme